MDIVRNVSSALSILDFPDTPWFLAQEHPGPISSSLHCKPTPCSKDAITSRKPPGSLLCCPSQISSAPHTPRAEGLQGSPEGCFCTSLPPLFCFLPLGAWPAAAHCYSRAREPGPHVFLQFVQANLICGFAQTTAETDS